MPYDIDDHIIEYCAPTLAGHKCGCLFSCRINPDTVEETSRFYREMLAGKGVSLEIIPSRCDRYLVYVFRPAALQKRLGDENVRSFLSRYGYNDFETAACIKNMSKRISECGGFPHEIGIFLDYPLDDVTAFIANHGEGYACLGWWKCYTDIDAAMKRFALFNKCRDVYCRCYRRGFGLYRLTVSA